MSHTTVPQGYLSPSGLKAVQDAAATVHAKLATKRAKRAACRCRAGQQHAFSGAQVAAVLAQLHWAHRRGGLL